MTGTSKDDDLEGMDYPSTSEKLEQKIGAFFIAWGVLERELDSAFPILFHTDPTLACCLYANLGTKAKLDTLKSAVSMLTPALGDNLANRAHNLLQTVSDLSDVARNTLAHGQVHPFLNEQTNKIVWELIRHSARKSHAMVIHPGTQRYWGKQQRAVVEIARRWRRCVAAIYRKTKSLTLNDLDRICLTQIRESKQVVQRPRKNQPQSKSSLEGRQARRARWPRPPRNETP
jgi:hypothetical protein